MQGTKEKELLFFSFLLFGRSGGRKHFSFAFGTFLLLFAWRLFLFGDYFCLATIFVWRLFLFGDYFCLATISVWRLLLFGDDFCLATILVWRSFCLAVILFGDHFVWRLFCSATILHLRFWKSLLQVFRPTIYVPWSGIFLLLVHCLRYSAASPDPGGWRRVASHPDIPFV